MYRIGRLTIAAAAAALVFAAAPVQAQTICVNPNKSNCQSTIQAAVDLATAGQEVRIENGTFFENVDVPVGKDGLTIRGGKGAIVDPDDRYECSGAATSCFLDADCPLVETCNNVGTGPAFTLNSNSVVLRGFTIRNGATDGIFVAADVTGTRITSMTISSPDNDCIELNRGNNNTIVEKSTLEGCGISGIASRNLPNSNNVQAISNTFNQIGSAGADITGNGTIFEKNRCNNINDDCAQLDGDLVEIVNNRCDGCEDVAEVRGNDALVDRNRGSNLGAGVNVYGDDPVVTNNRIDGTSGTGLNIDCPGGVSCSGGLISGNRVTDGRSDGLFLETDLPGLIVENNTISDVQSEGINGDCIIGVTLDRNRVNGTDNGERPCYDICGDGNTLSNNRADNCSSDGFEVDDDNNTLEKNSVKNALRNGFSINGTGNSFTDNSATDTNGVGFAVESGATNTTLGGNKASKNRVGACNEGTNTTGIANNDFDQVVPRCPSL